MTQHERITERFAGNLARVRNLVRTSGHLQPPDAHESTSVHTDILRAAVVLLHATMEDLLRSLEELVLRRPTPEAITRFRLAFPPDRPNERSVEKYSLHQLAKRYPYATVESVIRQAVDTYLGHTNYNNSDDLAEALLRIGLRADTKPLLDQLAARLLPMMLRRHQIVHRADFLSQDPGSILFGGAHLLQSFEVESWAETVQQFGAQVLAGFQETSS